MKKILLILWALLTVGLIAWSGYLFMQNRDLNRQINETNEEKNQRLVDEINKVYTLPNNEDPTIVYVSNPEVAFEENPGLKDIFSDLQKGDYILLYKKNRVAIQYRQSENKVIKTSAINLPVAIELVGSEAAVSAAEEQLGELGSSVSVQKTIKTGISQSGIYDVDQDQSEETKQLADRLSLTELTTLPDTISPGSSTEIVILLADTSATTQEP